MTRKFNPATLFAPRKHDPKLAPYKSYEAVLDAVGARKKALWRESFSLRSIEDDSKGFVKLLKMAFERKLAVTLHNYHPLPADRLQPNLYVLPLDQVWRISALNALRDTAFIDGGRWTLAAEAQESLLLGYTDAQRARWIEAMNHDRPAYGCNTIYTLLNNEQRELVMSVGKRCFGPAAGLEGMTLFFHRQYDDLKKNALRLLPKGTTLARVGLDWKACEALFGSLKTTKPRLASVVLSKMTATSTNAGLRSNVQFLTASGWS